MAEQENGTLSDLALSTPPNVLSSKSSDISIEELGMEESEALEAQLESNSDTTKQDNANAVKDGANESGSLEKANEKVEDKAIIDNGSEEPSENPQSCSTNAASLEDIKSKEETSTKIVSTQSVIDDEEEEEEDDFDDETMMERVIALSEMFPPGLLKTVSSLGNKSVESTKWVYSKGRNLTWMVFSTAALLFLPVMLESERVSFEEMEKAKRQQILLGPSAAMSSPATNAPLPPNPS